MFRKIQKNIKVDKHFTHKKIVKKRPMPKKWQKIN